MVWMEDNICIYRYGEILHTSAVLVGTIHVIQGIYINWREPAFSSVVCKQKVCLTTKRRMAKEMQVVGGPNSKMYVGSDSIKKKINISKEFVNKIRGTVSFLRCSNNYTSLRGEQQATISYNRMRCDKY